MNAPETPLSKLTLQILWKIIPIWKKLSNRGITAFRGINMELFQLALVYDWGENIVQYVESHPEASRPTLVLRFLPRDTTNLT